MNIVDVCLLLFLAWAIYDTIRHEGWATGAISSLIVASIVAVLVLVPYFFADFGKKLMYGLFGIIASIMVYKKLVMRHK